MLKKLAIALLTIFVLAVCLFFGYIALLQIASYQTLQDEIQEAKKNDYDRIVTVIGYLTTIPPEIGELDKLVDLAILYNSIRFVPTEIGNLENLQNLALTANRIRTLPPEIGNLSNLTRLVLSDNILTELPPEIGNLTNLETLWLQDNRLTSLPSEISNLVNLTDIKLGNNPFDAPPEIIEQGDWAIFEYYANRNVIE
jgi:hypothetical protein